MDSIIVKAVAGLLIAGGAFLVLRKFRKSSVLSEVRDSCELSLTDLEEIVKDFISQMHSGLRADKPDCGSLPMLPSFATFLPTGKEMGTYFALDLGGTNFRILRVTLKGDGSRPDVKTLDMRCPPHLMRGSAEDLFAFIADCLARFIQGEPRPASPWPLGFTFSFPMRQAALDSGILLAWTKGFACTTGVNADVVPMLAAELKKRDIPMQVKAILNDTVGTLASARYVHAPTAMAIILGTGTNAAYVEDMDAITKLRDKPLNASQMVINMEWGQFESTKLRRMKTDYELDAASLHPGEYLFEKLIGGMNLGENCRRIILRLVNEAKFFGGVAPPLLCQPFSLSSPQMADIDGDCTPTLSITAGVLMKLGVAKGQATLDELQQVKEVCVLLRKRAASLVAAGIAAVLTQQKHSHPVARVAIDGGLYENYVQFSSNVDRELERLLPNIEVVLRHARDGSGIGAALLAAASVD